MDPGTVVFIALNVVVAVAAIAGAEYARRRLHAQVGTLGLERHGQAYRGTVEGLFVEAGLPGERGSSLEMRLVVRPFESPAYLGPPALRPFAPVVLTGDKVFDRAVAVTGDEAAIRGALDELTRATVAGKPIRVHYGQLVGHYTTEEAAKRLLEIALVLHRRFTCTTEERLAQLEANVRHDPLPGVRERSLDALARVPGGRERSSLLARESELDEGLRVRAAIAAGSSDVLATIAASTTDGACLAAATEFLGSSGSRELSGALDRVRHFVRESPSEALVQVLGRHGTVADIPMLAVLRDEGRADLRRPARDAVGAIQRRIMGSQHGALAIADSLQGGEIAVAEGGALAEAPAETPKK